MKVQIGSQFNNNKNYKSFKGDVQNRTNNKINYSGNINKLNNTVNIKNQRATVAEMKDRNKNSILGVGKNITSINQSTLD
jgi:hypothetical protein